MKTRLAAAFVALVGASSAYAAGCGASAVDKNGKDLAGAARNSFMAKCERESKAACEKAAADKKLNGAARTSFVTKCVKDAA